MKVFCVLVLLCASFVHGFNLGLEDELGGGEVVKCTGDLVYKSCGTACPNTCQHGDMRGKMCAQVCVRGCQCPSGMFRDGDTDKCYKSMGECKKAEEESRELQGKNTCPGDLVWHECASACPKICGQKPADMCIQMCSEGCACPHNMFLNEKENTCHPDLACQQNLILPNIFIARDAPGAVNDIMG